MRKKIIVLLLALSFIFSLVACTGNDNAIKAKTYTPEASYTAGTVFTLNVDDYFDNNSGAEYTSNIGTIEDNVFSLLLTEGAKNIEITAAKDGKTAVLSFTLNVSAASEETPDYAAWAAENKTRAVAYAKTIYTLYWRSDNTGSRTVPNGSGYPYLWPYTEQIAMYNAVLEILDEEEDASDYALIKNYLEKSITGVRYYRLKVDVAPYTTVAFGTRAASGKSYAAYNSGRSTKIDERAVGKGGVYFDDNIWVARELLSAYSLTGEQQYLNECLNIMDWIIGEGMETRNSAADAASSVTAGTPMTGIYWLWSVKDVVGTENDDSKNASLNSCSTAPTAMVALKLYNLLKANPQYTTLVTGYKDRAMEMLNFMNRVLRSTEASTLGLYCDKVFLRKNAEDEIYLGMIDQQKLPYNTGCMIMAEAELAKIPASELTNTHKNMQNIFKGYMAESAARANVIYATSQPGGLYSFPSNSWFSSFMTDAYEHFHATEPELAEEYLYKMKITLDYAWVTHKDAQGLVAPAWYTGWEHPDYAGKNGDNEANPRQILLQSANARCYAVFAKFYATLVV